MTGKVQGETGVSTINATNIIALDATKVQMTTNSCDAILFRQKQMRKIRLTRRSVSGFYAFRGETSIQFESTLERDFLIRAEFFLDVLDIISQPAQIPFVATNGQTFTYTPDFLVYYRLSAPEYYDCPKPMLVEVKPTEEWKNNWRKWLPKWKAAWRYAQDMGFEFHIYDESRIRDQTLENIRFLERYKRMQFSDEESQGVVENIRKMGRVPFHYILAQHFIGLCQPQGIAHIWYLLATRQLECDISRPLNDFSELWVSAYE